MDGAGRLSLLVGITHTEPWRWRQS
jgi:hypothetical protein